MTNCPICSGKLLITASKAGEEVYCIKCLSVIKSASLKFSYNASDLAGEVTECSDAGLPGYKGSGKKAKCHVYTPGDEAGQSTAKQKAKQSAYTTQKKSHIENLIREGAFGGMDTTQVPEFATTNNAHDSNCTCGDCHARNCEPCRQGSSEEAPTNAIGTQMSKDGVWDNNLFGDVNNNSGAAAY